MASDRDGVSAYQRDGQWIGQYKDAGKWREKRIPREAAIRNRREAIRWVRDWLGTKAADPAPVGDVTIATYAAAWLEVRDRNPKLRPSTRRNNKGHVESHIIPKLGGLRLSELKPQRIADFVAGIDGAPYTVRNVASTLKAMLDHAVADGVLPANPARNKIALATLPAAATEAGDVVIYVERAAAVALAHCPAVLPERRTRYALAFLTGLRDGEIAALRWADVDFDAEVPFVSVTRQLTGEGDFAPPKTRHGKREVPLHPVAVRMLQAWRDGGWTVLVGHKARPGDAVLPNGEGDFHRPESSKVMRRDLSTAGLPTTREGHLIDFHATRRSFATWLAAAGVSESLIKRLLGHSGAGVTDRHYRGKALVELAQAVGRIDFEPPDVQAAAIGAEVAETSGPETVGACRIPCRTPRQEVSQVLAPPIRFERTTHGLGNRCSIP